MFLSSLCKARISPHSEHLEESHRVQYSDLMQRHMSSTLLQARTSLKRRNEQVSRISRHMWGKGVP